jgi:hypothetical protein
MDKVLLKKMLFKVAFCALAADGKVDDREIKEMQVMDKNTSYFADIDLSEELNNLINGFEIKGKKIIEELFNELHNSELTTIQELLVLEIALRIISSDNEIDANEVKYIKLLRSKLKVHDEIIKERFGVIEYLMNKDYETNIKTNASENDFITDMIMPELQDLKTIDFSTLK